jgi:hypothetical protein
MTTVRLIPSNPARAETPAAERRPGLQQARTDRRALWAGHDSLWGIGAIREGSPRIEPARSGCLVRAWDVELIRGDPCSG